MSIDESLIAERDTAQLHQVTVSVIIVNWNSKRYVLKCVESLFTHCSKLQFEIIVIDSGSFDGVGDALREQFPHVHFLQCEDNVGFGRSNNIAVTHARGRHLLFLNPDTILHEDTIAVLSAKLDTLPQAGAIGCRVLNPDGTIQLTSVLTYPTILNRTLGAAFVQRLLRKTSWWGHSHLFSDREDDCIVEAVSGACVIISKDRFEEVGGFDPRYFMYGEDVDLCYKLMLRNLKIYHVRATSIIHFGGGSSDQAASNFSTVMMRESWYKFIRHHYSVWHAYSFKAVTFVSSVAHLLLIPPLMIFGNRIVAHKRGSLRKWFAVLRWTAGA